jgi:L-alanine-DL-glutamate epimerase-like enolase superfamily enzyme
VARLPLKTPYHLSFITLTEYSVVWVRYEDEEGGVGLGEAVPLPGYGWETLEDVQAAVADLTRRAAGLHLSQVAERCRLLWPTRPFAASAVMTALQFPELLEAASLGAAFPLNWPVAGDAPLEALRKQVETGLVQGYRFIKVKVGRNLAAELANLPLLLTEWPDRDFGVLFDANQGFSLKDALAFAQGLKAHDQGRLRWFEQPLDREDWDALTMLCSRSPVPIILDESIYSAEHIRRAAAMGAQGVKLKLFKQCGPQDAMTQARLARSLGLSVVFGNGVASDVGNLAEYLLLAMGGGLFTPPAESNGFCKLANPLLGNTLAVQNGSLTLATPVPEMIRRVQSFTG